MDITIIGKRWFQKTYGNTYHSVEIFVDGQQVHKIDFCYGYGNQYIYNAAKWLHENGYMPDRAERPTGSPPEALWTYCERKGINLIDRVIDVTRKKDL